MCNYNISETRDKSALAKFFATNRTLYAYLLGDLDPFFFENTSWRVARSAAQADSPIEASLLNYHAFSTPVLIGLEENNAQAALWREALSKPLGPAHTHYRKVHEEIITNAGDIQPLGTHFRMAWNPDFVQTSAVDNNLKDGNDLKDDSDLSEVVTLLPGDIEDIRELHKCAYDGAYFDERLLQTGQCFGIFREKQFVAFAGCHVYSVEYDIAALGAITTHPEYRNQGLGAKVSLRALEELRKTVACICLNVHSENHAAIKIYERLGFQIHCEYEEAIVIGRQSR